MSILNRFKTYLPRNPSLTHSQINSSSLRSSSLIAMLSPPFENPTTVVAQDSWIIWANMVFLWAHAKGVSRKGGVWASKLIGGVEIVLWAARVREIRFPIWKYQLWKAGLRVKKKCDSLRDSWVLVPKITSRRLRMARNCRLAATLMRGVVSRMTPVALTASHAFTKALKNTTHSSTSKVSRNLRSRSNSQSSEE